MTAILVIVYFINMFILILVWDATVWDTFILLWLFLDCFVLSCFLLWGVLKRYMPVERVLFCFFILGPIILCFLLGVNYITASTHPAIYRIRDYKIEDGKTAATRGALYFLELEDHTFDNYKKFRTFEAYSCDTSLKSIVYDTGRGFLGIEVVKGHKFSK